MNFKFFKKQFHAAAQLYGMSYAEAQPSQLDSLFVLSNRAECYLKLGLWKQVEADYKEALRLHPQHDKTQFHLGKALYLMQEYKEACMELGKAADVNARDDSIREALAKSQVLLAQSTTRQYGEFLEKFVMSGRTPDVASDCFDYLSPVEIQMTANGRGRGLFATKDIKARRLVMNSKEITFSRRKDQHAIETGYDLNEEMLSKLVKDCMKSKEHLRKIYLLHDGAKKIGDINIPSMCRFGPNKTKRGGAMNLDDQDDLLIDVECIELHRVSEFSKMAFPNFHERRGENAGNFLDDLEMAFLVSGREDEEVKLRAFPLVLREEAKVWFQDLDMGKQGNWEALKRAFLLRYSGDNNPKEIWRKLSKLQQASPNSYSEYETQFLKLWTQWENSLPKGERAPNFLQKERFLAGLTPILREKVKCKFPGSFKEALTWARLKDRKLQFQRSWRDHSQAASRVTTLELPINLIHGLQPEQPVQQQAGGRGPNDKVPRRPPRREYQCHNYGEDKHGMYFCPYPRGYGNAPPRGPQQQVSPPRMRPPPMPMCEQQQQPQQHQTIQISRQSTYAPVPQFATEVPPLPHDGVEQAMNVISCEGKGEEKIMEAEAMPGKQATVAKESCQMTTNDGANKKERKRKKKASMTRRKIGIINFPGKSKPQDLIEEVQRQEPKLTWPQLLHLSPRMRRQWSKIVSTRRSKNVNTLKAQLLEDDVPVLDTPIKGQRVSSDYVDGGGHRCVS
ncbi:hypothetical protein L7F22_067305 [Adiantum nelumboides]|nr:hypothetical protein [Adiantum nelumboides]